MIFLRLFFTFLKIGIFSFGGGLAMIALIQNEVVEKNNWMTLQEFTDVVATSQFTPGPVGINTATYAGYTAVVNAGYDQWMGVVGAFVASFSVILLPVLLMLVVSRFIVKYKNSPYFVSIMRMLRLIVVGFVAAAALLLISPENFGSFNTNSKQFFVSIALFLCVFFASFKYKTSPILLILLSGIVGLLIYGI